MYRQTRVGAVLLPLADDGQSNVGQLPDWLDRVVVVEHRAFQSRPNHLPADDKQADRVEMVREPRRGLGAAAMAGCSRLWLGDRPDLVVLLAKNDVTSAEIAGALDALLDGIDDVAIARDEDQRERIAAVRLDVLQTLELAELHFGWFDELELKAGRHAVSASGERLLVFSRFPIPGQTKTRLIPALGPQGAADLQRQMTAHTLRVAAGAVDNPRRIEVRFTGGTRLQMATDFGPVFQYMEQGEGDLGERMTRAFHSAFQHGAQRVVCIGSDCSGITPEVLQSAWRKLKTRDVVLGPATDGGYYLIGMRSFLPGVFRQIDWGTGNVFAQTKRWIEFNGLSLATLPTLSDVDEAEDLPVWEEAKLTAAANTSSGPLLSVVIPALNAAASLAAAIDSARLASDAQIIVCDGGSTDATCRIARECRAELIEAGQGRGRQLNAGAATATGDHLLFLHADTRLPLGYERFVRRALRDKRNIAGAFRLAFDTASLPLRLVEWGTSLRARYGQLPYGDQALFLRRETFEQLGGFSETRSMEDYALVEQLRRLGHIAISPQAAITSADKYLRNGVWRTVLAHHRHIWNWWGTPGE